MLVDCWGHTAGSRLGMFAQRAAPVQVAWINFLQTTGLSRMDYVIHCDSMAVPGTAELFTETVISMGEIMIPYRPHDARAEPTPTPALASGRITFGSFNHPAKLSDATVAAWSRILKDRPGARLILKYRYFIDPVLQAVTRARFLAEGSRRHASNSKAMRRATPTSPPSRASISPSTLRPVRAAPPPAMRWPTACRC